MPVRSSTYWELIGSTEGKGSGGHDTGLVLCCKVTLETS